MNSNFFEIKNLSKTFKNKSGINEISFSLNRGDIVGFLGDNGTGKTTTIKLIFNEYIKNGGQILFENEDISKSKAFIKMSFFPDQNNYPKNFNIVEFAIYNARLKNISKKDILKNLELYLEALSLTEYKNNSFNELSAGMQKRALLLSILITDPEIIVLDEPTANLDIKSRLDFLNILSHLSINFKKTIIITSHNIDELSNLINRVIIINKVNGKGEIIYNNFFNNKTENLRDIYLKQIGGLSSNIDYQKISTIKNEFKKEKQDFFLLNLPIVNRIFCELLKSKLFIIMTSTLFVLTLFFEFLFLYALPPKNFDINSTLLAWLPFSMIVFYIGYYEVHFVARFYNKEINEGVFNLEIRSGLSKQKIFWQRVLINKLIIFSYILIVITILAIFIPTTSNFYSVKTLLNVLPGYFVLFILDILIFSILCLFMTLNSAVLIGMIGTLFALFGSISLLIDASITLFIFPSYTTSNLNDNQDYLKLYNTRFLIGQDLERIINKYKDKSIVKQHLNSLETIENIFNFDQNDKFLTEYNFILNDNSYSKYISSQSYIQRLLLNGLLTEADNLKIYNENGEVKLNLSEEFESNKLITDLKEITKFQIKTSETNLKNTLFREYSKNELINKELYQNSNGLYELIDLINSNQSSELKEIANLIKQISKYGYDKYNLNKGIDYSVLEKPINFYGADTPMWTYTNNKTFNTKWDDKIKISDGARTFNKIYTDLLVSYINLKNPIYGNSDDKSGNPAFNLYAKEYNKFARMNSYLDPFTTFSRIVFESSYDKFFNALYYSTEWINTTYELVNYNSSQSNIYAKKFDSIKKVGNTFSPSGASFLYLLIDIVILGFSYLIYNRKIIK